MSLSAGISGLSFELKKEVLPVDKLIMIVLLVITLLSTAMVMSKGSEATRKKVADAIIGAVITSVLVLAVFVAVNGWALFG